MALTPLVIHCCAFISAVALALLLGFRLLREDERLQTRLEEMFDEPAHAESLAHALPPNRSSRLWIRDWMLPRLGLWLLPYHGSQRTRLETRLLHAGIYAPAALAAYLGMKSFLICAPLLAGLASGTLGIMTLQRGLLVSGVVAGVGMILPGLWLDHRKKRRQAILERSLPDFLDLMVTCVESGTSLEAAIQRVTDELQIAHPLLTGELRVAQRQIDFGSTPDAALGALANRTDCESLHALQLAVQQTRQYGASISEALRTQAEMLRSNREMCAEERAQKAAVKILFPTLLFIFPAVFVVLAGPAAIKLCEKFSSPGASVSRSR